MMIYSRRYSADLKFIKPKNDLDKAMPLGHITALLPGLLRRHTTQI